MTSTHLMGVDIDVWQQVIKCVVWVFLAISFVITLGTPMKWLTIALIRRWEGRNAWRNSPLDGWNRVRHHLRRQQKRLQGFPQMLEEMVIVAWRCGTPAVDRLMADIDVWSSDDRVVEGATALVTDLGPHLGREFIQRLQERGVLGMGVPALIEEPSAEQDRSRRGNWTA